MTRSTRLLAALLASVALSGLAASGHAPAGEPAPPADAPLPEHFTLAVPDLPAAGAPDGRIYLDEGFEGDLAALLGEGLGRPLHLAVPTTGAPVPGRFDGVLLRLRPDDPRLASGAAVPLGYRSGLSVAMRSDTAIRRWEDLAGRTVCASAANRDGQRIARAYGAAVVTVRAPAVALMRLRTGACDASIHDRALLDALFTSRAWAKFSATLPPVEPTLLALVPAATGPGAALRRAAAALDDPLAWRQRRARWGSTVAFEVYRDQVGGDCH